VRELEGDAPRNSAQIVLDEATVVLPLEGLIDLAAEKARLTRDLSKTRVEAAKVEAKLANADFVARAKPEVVEENRDRLAHFQAEIARLEAALNRLE
jgi:valyl-tRNA synthetase